MSPARRHAVRSALHHHQGGQCCYCGTKLVMPKGEKWGQYECMHNRAATLEHLRRKADGGTNHSDNLALACRKCNAKRGAMSWVEFKTLRAPNGVGGRA